MKKLFAVCILSVIAFANATYLTLQNYKIEQSASKGELSTFCDINNVFSCTNVLSSPYSKVSFGFITGTDFSLPFTAIAMFVYPIIFLIAFLGTQGIIRKPYHYLVGMGIGGILFNGYFIAQEYLYIGAYCPLCLLCTGIIITILVLGIIGIRSDSGKKK